MTPIKKPLKKAGNLPSAQLVSEEFLAAIPQHTGVYIMKDVSGTVVYVGKAANLRSRVRSYYRPTSDTRAAVRFVSTTVTDIEVCLTDTEKEALILENNLIKKHKPRYNIRLRDDKHFLSLRLNLKEPVPRFEYVRRQKNDGALYFGPFSSSRYLREMMRHLQWLYPIRTCKTLSNRNRPCLMCQMRHMPCPCFGELPRDEYIEILKQVMMVLRGQNAELLAHLKAAMESLSAELKFEQAAVVRDRICAIEQSLEKQDIVTNPKTNKDFIGLFYGSTQVAFNVLCVRQGRMESSDNFMYHHHDIPSDELLLSFLQQLYVLRPPPDLVYVACLPEDSTALCEWLKDTAGRTVSVHAPLRGENVRLIAMAEKNARQHMVLKEENDTDLALLQKTFRLKNVPVHMECFDISAFQGDSPVGAQAVFIDGKPRKNLYRRYIIKNVEGQNDFAMMREMFQRRIERASREQKFPDLCIIDGGKGQLSAVWAYYSEIQETVPHIDIIALAKEHIAGEGERVFLPNRKDGIALRAGSPEKKLLDRIRDETHRFAVTFHRVRRAKKVFSSSIRAVPGIGEYHE
ncbi:excinuclease ABC subunit UvrC, partial [bacterium]|nr:excinuclease ABC subunit UvrC [bacterium]